MSLKNYQTMDPQLLLGLVNTRLRNDCESLEDLIKRDDLDEKILVTRLEAIGYSYFSDINQFRSFQ